MSELKTSDLLSRLRMGQVERFHTRPLIRRQTTAEHSGRVALLLVSFWPEATATAIKAALFHDLAEHYTGDIPAPVKWKYPALGAAISAIEGEIDQQHGLTLGMLTPDELWWLKWCDNFEGACKCLEELAMGNRLAGPPFEKWLDLLRRFVEQVPDQDTYVRLHAMIGDLEVYFNDLDLLAGLYQ